MRDQWLRVRRIVRTRDKGEGEGKLLCGRSQDGSLGNNSPGEQGKDTQQPTPPSLLQPEFRVHHIPTNNSRIPLQGDTCGFRPTPAHQSATKAQRSTLNIAIFFCCPVSSGVRSWDEKARHPPPPSSPSVFSQKIHESAQPTNASSLQKIGCRWAGWAGHRIGTRPMTEQRNTPHHLPQGVLRVQPRPAPLPRGIGQPTFFRLLTVA